MTDEEWGVAKAAVQKATGCSEPKAAAAVNALCALGWKSRDEVDEAVHTAMDEG